MESHFKEVWFDLYCQTCRHKDVVDHDDPCDECLYNTYNINSHKPVNWEEKDK